MYMYVYVYVCMYVYIYIYIICVCIYVCIEGIVQGLHFDDTCTMEVSLGEDAEKGGNRFLKSTLLGH